MKTVSYLERPFFIHGGRVINAVPESIEIHKGRVVYKIEIPGYKLILHKDDVFEDEDSARRSIK